LITQIPLLMRRLHCRMSEPAWFLPARVSIFVSIPENSLLYHSQAG
jgi:hypothetical protein